MLLMFPEAFSLEGTTFQFKAFDIAVSHVLLALLSPNTMPKEKGVSRSVSLVVGNVRKRGALSVRNLKQRDLVNERSRRQDRYELNTSDLSNESLTLLSNLQNSNAEPTFAMDVDDPSMDPDLEWETVPETLKDDDTFMHAVQDIVGSQWRVYKDGRTWHQRVTRLQENWAPIIKDLTLAYLAWKYPLESPPNNAVLPPPPPSSPSSYDFDIECIDIYTLSNTTHIQRNASVKTASEALVLNGYIGATPQSPSIAISLHTLELYRRICLQKPLFSAEAFTKVLCDLYNILNVPALGRNSPNWRVLNACPPCSFKLKGEPPLLYRCMIVFDGNNSLSRMAPLGGSKVGDMRTFDSDFFLSRDYVNLFADEVLSSQAPSSQALAHQDAPQLQVGENLEKRCTENWKAAADEAKKQTWGIFEETGIFACACRHGMILWIVDMVRSGELFKYLLSIMNKALEVLSPRLLIGYDVGCKLATTVKSTTLATKFNESNSRLCIDAFHGYTHNYACQDRNYPNVIQGMGLEDFSTMERIFSSSNQLAPVIRYASAYNRHFFIDMFFKQWDEDKYMNIGNMLYNNYRQAHGIIECETIEFEHAKLSLGITDASIKEWQKQQLVYLETLGEEAEWDVHAMTYIELLQNLRDARAAAQCASASFLDAIPTDYQFVLTLTATSMDAVYANNLSRTRKLETQRRHANECLDRILQEIVAMEVKMGIMRRWEPSDSEYADTMRYMATRKYHRTLDELQRLVVLRLFELHKLNLSQTGYRMRTHIAKALQTRCKAIQSKVKEYNAAASALVPPAPSLDWSRVSHYGFLDEFTLLRETRQDVQTNQWTHPEVRELMRQSLRIKRAHEEVHHCNIELCRLHSFIAAENHHFEVTLQCLKAESNTIYHTVKEFTTRRIRINSHNLARVFQTFSFTGFTGDKTVGMKKSSSVLNHSLTHAVLQHVT
ncbi:hypothetical protein EV424DRAFT_1543713 [Suillus variegatus]|nr:hypothetical protein EV424DRAFT_1543713 [Suillus variegatus]